MAEPKFRVSMAISPSHITLGDESCTLTLTATLDYTHSITVYTWPSIFNLSLAQRRHNFSCTDLTSRKDLNMAVELPQRLPTFHLHIGCYDDQFLVTFHPGIPVTITEKFDLATRSGIGDTLQPGHRYTFGIDREGVSSWLHGTREDVMTTEHVPSRNHERSDLQVELDGLVEFEVADDVASRQFSLEDLQWKAANGC